MPCLPGWRRRPSPGIVGAALYHQASSLFVEPARRLSGRGGYRDMKSFDLTGRVAMVTGGNGGIGLGMARGLAEAGAAVVVAARNREKSEAAVAGLAALGGAGSAFVALDVADAGSCRDAVRQTVERFSRLDILVNNAGMSIRKPPQDYAIEEWQLVLNTNLTGAFACAQAAYAPMKKAGGGKIINIGSMMSIFGGAYAAAYSASKGGIVQLTKSLATAWAGDNIQANAVLPGWIDTDLTAMARQQVEGLHDRVLRRTPAGRWGRPEDLAGVAVYLASPASDFVTGAVIPVDGGYSAEF
jgi:2-deoxy-D-gluconate 3-dehydrogenase